MTHGVWQSLQTLVVTRYSPRATLTFERAAVDWVGDDVADVTIVVNSKAESVADVARKRLVCISVVLRCRVTDVGTAANPNGSLEVS
ncbi:MAG: hypothetical protein AMXMBFR57_11170 [Acidimicrobiia bacterium]